MKMELFSGAFWGILLIVIGILLVIKYVFNIQFPIGRIVFAVILIYAGISLLLGNHGHCRHHNWTGSNTENSTAFSNQQFSYSPAQNKYSCAFGSSILDLSDVTLTEDKTLELSVAFGEFIVKMNRNANFETHSGTAFGSTKTPDGSMNAFGQRTYYSSNFNKSEPHFILRTNVAFGSLKIIYN
jgi:predicted membrane protein